MVFLKIRGGAGNQFAQYAYTRAILHGRGDSDELWIDDAGIYSTSYNNFLDDHLKWFNTYPYCIRKIPKARIVLRLLCRLFRMLFRSGTERYVKAHTWLARRGLCSLDGVDYCEVIPRSRNVYIEGNFENPKYYDDIRHILLQDFKLKPNYVIRENQLVKRIKEKESICVSVRKWPKEEVTFKREQLTASFYKEAVRQICERLGRADIRLILFSNDTDFCKQLEFDQEVYIEDGDGTIYEKLLVMALCDHFVLSNSTFSWWAQYLCEKEDKIVVSPYCPKLGYFKYFDPPGGVKRENWIMLNTTTGERVN